MRFWHEGQAKIPFVLKAPTRQMKFKSIYDKDYYILLNCLRTFREKAGLTQQELGVKVGYDQTLISKIESGDRRIDVIELRRICIAMNISIIDFIDEMEQQILTKTKNADPAPTRST
jgi:ribosome-binding protein aMBF1 (putative translation factor)